MIKWCGDPIVITMIKKWLQVIWYEQRQPYPPPTYVPMYLCTIYLPIHLHLPPTLNPPIYLPTTYLPICLSI
jgi:hypothetical protein